MAKCSFCGKQMQKGQGMLFVKKDGTASFFCSGKCKNNGLKLKRSPFATKWTLVYQQEKQAGKKSAGTKGKKPVRKKTKRKKKKRKRK